MSPHFTKIIRRSVHWGLIGVLVWVTARLPIPVLHAHAGHPLAADEMSLGQHVERCHGEAGGDAFFDWHLHWFSPGDLFRLLGEGDCDSTPGTDRTDAPAICTDQESSVSLSLDMDGKLTLASSWGPDLLTVWGSGMGFGCSRSDCSWYASSREMLRHIPARRC